MNGLHVSVDNETSLAPHVDLLQRTLSSRVHEVATVTALDHARLLSERFGNCILLKREDQQPVFSFKLRGAYNKISRLSMEERLRGVIAASAGNHAQGVAVSANKLGIRAVIVMPVTAPQLKVDAVRRFGGDMVEVILHGDSFTEANSFAAQVGTQRNLVFVHPFDDMDVIAGQATVAMELMRQLPKAPDAVFVPVGGGGLLSGIAGFIKSVSPNTMVFGVQSSDSDAMAQSLELGYRVALKEVGLFADGTAVKQVGSITYDMCKQFADGIIRVDGDALCSAIRDVYMDTRSIPEPSGALAVAGLKQYIATQGCHDATLVAIVSGANMNFERLRFVSERAESGEQQEALFAVTIPEERGSFRRFCRALGKRSITEFNYRIGDARVAHIFVGVRTANQSERSTLASLFLSEGFSVLDLSDDELAKLHLRHMVGGRSALACNERLFRFDFPERPGALPDFLNSLHPDWNISLFHYRNHGADHGRILVGIQIPDEDLAFGRKRIGELSYPFVEETDNPAYQMLLRA